MLPELRCDLGQFVGEHHAEHTIVEIMATGVGAIAIERESSPVMTETRIGNQRSVWQGVIEPTDVEDVMIVIKEGPAQIGVRFNDGSIEWSALLAPELVEQEPEPEPAPARKRKRSTK